VKKGDEVSADADRINDLPSLSVRRPVLVLVLNLLIVLGGIAAILAVETRELPDVDRPIVSVRAEYPGASPETMDAEVISILEGAVARVSGIQNIESASEENNGRMRIEFRPGSDLDSAASDVREAVSRVLRFAAFDVPAGSFRSDDQELIVRADASVVTPEAVESIIIRDTISIGDVADVYFGPEDARSLTRLDGRPVIGIGIVRQARSNTIEISDGINRVVGQLNRRFDDIDIVVTNDNAVFIKSSIREVLFTLSLTISIVIATIWLFIGSIRATLVPSIAIPVALIGTVAAIWVLGFSINILTLLALVLATGMVVDDAIVVLENIKRRRGQGLGARAAAVLGTRQVFFAVVTTTAVLVAVFVPIAFLPSTAGRLFREFGLVLAAAVVISSFVSLTLVPAAASRLPADFESHALRRAVKRFGGRLAGLYRRSLHFVLDYPFVPIAAALVFAAVSAGLFTQLDRSLLPDEDRGLVSIRASGPDGVGIGYMDRQTHKIEDMLGPLLERGEVQSVRTVVGAWDPNRSWLSIPLVDWRQRKRSQQEIIESIEGSLSEIPGVYVSVYGSNSLNLRDAGGELEVALVGNEYDEIFQAAKSFARAIEDRGRGLSQPQLSYEPTQPQLSVDIDRRRAAELGIDLDSLAATLRAMIDGDELLDLNIGDEAVPILLESSSGEINDPSDLVNLYVGTASGQLVPLSSVATLREEGVAAELDRHAQRRAIEVDIALDSVTPLADAVEQVRAIGDDVLPDGVSMILLGEAQTLEETSREVAITYLIALAVVFLVLAAQFEGFTSPLIITLIVPFGIAAAIVALFLTGTSVNIYSQVGLVLLVGLMAKNSVLLVEFADQLRDRGASVRDAIEQGASIRLRPVAMTIISTVLGGLPLILSSGAGAEARASIGWVVFGGLGIAALFTLYLTPAIYVLLARLSSARAEEAERLGRELDEARRLAGESA